MGWRMGFWRKPLYYYGEREDRERVQWLKGGSGDGFLVWDHNRDGLITDNSELMSEYDKNGKAAFANGYEKLARYFDKDKNGIIEGSELNDLHFWVDDGDAVTEAEIENTCELWNTQIVIPGNAEQKSSTFTKRVEARRTGK